jgi:hypothetical protein
MPIKKENTNALTREAIRVFTICGFQCWRQNNGGVYDPTKKVFRANSSTPGISDIIGYNRKTGVILACEIKTGADKLNPYQVRFLDQIKAAGGYAYVVHTISDLTTILKDYKCK